MVALTVKLVRGLLPAALIVIPALTARNISKNSSQYSFGSLIFGAISAILGIFLSQITKYPAGLLIIISGFLIFLLSIILKKS
jgi:ABC-type Mn2+/Zn2+ transport system permease subunit